MILKAPPKKRLSMEEGNEDDIEERRLYAIEIATVDTDSVSEEEEDGRRRRTAEKSTVLTWHTCVPSPAPVPEHAEEEDGLLLPPPPASPAATHPSQQVQPDGQRTRPFSCVQTAK